MEKDWNFDEVIDRSDTGSMKWEPEILRLKFGPGRENLMPLWVADMDFYCPTVVEEAMAERLSHRIYGYTLQDPDYNKALIQWYGRRHNWEIKEPWLMSTPGIVPAVNYLVQRFTCPGDGVLIQTPVYYPFAEAIRNNGRTIVDNPLVISEGRYEMDFRDLAEKAGDPRVKMAILCSPHNPVGRVWTREELTRFGDICMDNNVLVFADEIHCDLVMPGFSHLSFQSISERFARGSIAANAASKTFNLAGLSHSSLVIPDPGKRADMSLYFQTLGMNPRGSGSLFGAIAARAAYMSAEPWLTDLIDYLHGNYIYLKQRIESEIPGAKVFDLQATYLPWIDFRPLGLCSEEVVRRVEKEAGLALDHGDWFGENGKGFERINIACPRPLLEKAVNGLVSAFAST
ncbi:MAG: pyridoxal phosphate-dependent aminotransferase [Desulfobacterales bacterium]|nr:pyridoxal phosphate-dependent aminotransferase [Desulfobacterales bacterium]